MSDAATIALLQLASPALPIGGFSYSTGLEWGVESGQVRDEPGAREWIADALGLALASFEGPLMREAMRAAAGLPEPAALDAIAALNAEAIAARETQELRLESGQMGYSLGRWLAAVCPDPAVDAALAARLADPHDGGGGHPRAAAHPGTQPGVRRAGSGDARTSAGTGALALPVAWAIAAVRLGLSERDALIALFWSFAENQAMVLMKAMPMGQIAAQRLLRGLTPDIVRAVDRAGALAREDWSSAAPGLAIASARHETQYSRLFRS
jgi:urease accessory protein